MTDRYAIYSNFKEITERYNLTGEEEFMIPNFNASPSQSLPIITHTEPKKISFVNWGIDQELANNKSVSPKLLTLPVELIEKKNPIKKNFLKSRCIVPANGFYAWKQYGKKRKVPHYFRHPAHEIISMVGIWEEFEDMNGEIKQTFKLLEKRNENVFSDFGNMMPITLSKDDETKFLDDYSTLEELMDLIVKDDMNNSFTNHSVSSLITNQSYNRKELIEPHAQVDQLGNYTLFD